MFELRFPTRILFGQNSFDQIGMEAREYGDRALIVTGGSAMRKAGVIDRAMELLRSAGLGEVELFDKVEHDPSTKTVDMGTEIARKCDADVVIGIGGGSALDAAKAIACMVKNAGSVEEYQAGKKIEYEGMPFIAVPTTAGTGAEITKNAVLTNKEKKIKESIRSPYMMAKVAIVDPILTATMPPDVTAATGMDTLTQSIEAYVARASNPVTDALAIRSINLIAHNIVRAFKDGNDMEARENMALGSLMGGMAFANSSLGAVHGLAHPIGAMFDAPHGVICALLLPHVITYNLSVATNKYAQIAEAMGQDLISFFGNYVALFDKNMNQIPLNPPLAKGGIERDFVKGGILEEVACMAVKVVKGLMSQLQLPQRLRELGIRESDLAEIAGAARGSSLNNNPRTTTPAELEEILLKAL